MSAGQSPVKPVLGPSERILTLPLYTLATVLHSRNEKLRQGVHIIDLRVGNPDLRPPQGAIDPLKAALDDPRVQDHRDPSFNGRPAFRAAVALDGGAAWSASSHLVHEMLSGCHADSRSSGAISGYRP